MRQKSDFFGLICVVLLVCPSLTESARMHGLKKSFADKLVSRRYGALLDRWLFGCFLRYTYHDFCHQQGVTLTLDAEYFDIIKINFCQQLLSKFIIMIFLSLHGFYIFST
jgi:hypothetical protein